MDVTSLEIWNGLGIFSGLGLTLYWLFVIYEGSVFQIKSKALFRASTASPDIPKSPTRVSVIVPAKDEEGAIESCLRSLLGQRNVDLEVIAVNDRSTDRTGALMRRVATDDTRLKVLEIATLPEMWMGKNHALHQGVQIATGSFILFTDGDILFEPQALSTCLSIMENQSLDHLVLGPKFLASSSWIAALQCYFATLFLTSMRPSRIGTSKKHYIGAGAFNMVRKTAYQAIGGHQKLALEILDDVMLGRVLSCNGAKQAVVDGQKLISLDWYPSVKAMIRGLEKNGFAALRYSLLNFFGLSVFTLWMGLAPYLLAIFARGPAQWVSILALALAHWVFSYSARGMGHSSLLTLRFPFAVWMMYWAFLRSTVVTLKNQSVNWRGTNYPLELLKENKVDI